MFPEASRMATSWATPLSRLAKSMANGLSAGASSVAWSNLMFWATSPRVTAGGPALPLGGGGGLALAALIFSFTQAS